MKIRPGFVIATLLTPLLVPHLVYLVAALQYGLGPAAAVDALVQQVTGGRPSPAVAGLLGLFPALLLLAVLFLLRWIRPEARWIAAAGWGGLGALLLVLIWVNFEAWPLYLPGRTNPGWPHGMELIIGPIFFAPVAIALALAIFGIAGASRG